MEWKMEMLCGCPAMPCSALQHCCPADIRIGNLSATQSVFGKCQKIYLHIVCYFLYIFLLFSIFIKLTFIEFASNCHDLLRRQTNITYFGNFHSEIFLLHCCPHLTDNTLFDILLGGVLLCSSVIRIKDSSLSSNCLEFVSN